MPQNTRWFLFSEGFRRPRPDPKNLYTSWGYASRLKQGGRLGRRRGPPRLDCSPPAAGFLIDRDFSRDFSSLSNIRTPRQFCLGGILLVGPDTGLLILAVS